MTQEIVLDYLIKHGEKINAEIKIPGMSSKRISAILANLYNIHKVTRSQVTHNSKLVWSYRASTTGLMEPDYAFILRNLPRTEKFEWMTRR